MRRLAVFLALLAPLVRTSAAQNVPSPPAAAPAESPYAGSEACGTCHEDISTAFTKSPHQLVDVDKKRGWQGRACEACHGPGQKHTESPSADNIRNPAKLTAARADQICLNCHLNQPTHVGRLENSHMKDQVACTACHKVHASAGMVARKAPDVNRLCATCHTNVWAQFKKPFHHRLPEEAMSCVDCHNPHGSIRPAMSRIFAANEPGCFSCHGDKRGPFTFEHAPVRFEGCGACHEPHGSANPRMLKRQEVRFVCLECHATMPQQLNTNSKLGVVPPAFHDLRSPTFRNCTVCHQKVHGSYVDRNLLR
jgi:DmsE family decaheme c-type cytochrome